MNRILAIISVFVVLTACAVGPKYTRPAVQVPSAYKEIGPANATGEWKPAQPSDSVPRGKWWECFHDPQLNALEEKLNISNQNIAAATANVMAARALLREAHAQYFPAVGVAPGMSNSRVSTGFGRPLGITYTGYSLPFEASWEPDLWGRVRNTVAANAAAVQASSADLENVRLSAQSDLAIAYYQLRAQDSLRRILDATVRANGESVELSRDRYLAKIDSDQPLAQAEAQLTAVQAQDTNLGVLRAQYEHSIALLTGQPASEFSLRAEADRNIPPSIPVGVPAQLLERRPDIAAAERAVAQANAQIGIAQTAWYPAVTLSASAGFQSLSIIHWLEWPSRIWAVGPGLAQTLFDGGLRKATLQQYQANYDQAVANYRQTVLTAFQQVEDNLAALQILGAAIRQQNEAIEAASRNLEEAEARYRAGLDPYLNVIAAQTNWLESQETAVNFESQQMVASVQLIKALGGGWYTTQSASDSPNTRDHSQPEPAGSRPLP